MIKYLYANGCSWTHGNGIHEDPTFRDGTVKASHQHNVVIQQYAWPNMLGEILNCTVNNDGWGAGSNSRMVRRTIEFLEKYPKTELDKLLVVIGWTTTERDEIYVNEYQRWMNYNAAQSFSDQFNSSLLSSTENELNKNIDKTQKQFVTWVHSTKYDLDRYFQQLYLMKNILENLKVKYLFFNSLPWTWVQPPDYKPVFTSLSSPNIIGYDDYETMLSFCKDNNLPLSSCMHPMLAGHKRWAERLHKQLKICYPGDIR
jgi:hypothetical protein